MYKRILQLESVIQGFGFLRLHYNMLSVETVFDKFNHFPKYVSALLKLHDIVVQPFAL